MWRQIGGYGDFSKKPIEKVIAMIALNVNNRMYN